MEIAFFDSGMGGVTVLHEALRLLPKENFIYFGDSGNVPYGTKSRDAVRRHILEAAERMTERPIKAMVIACNTATAVAINDLRQRYDFPVIGMEPAVKPAVQRGRDLGRRVLVLATPLTLKLEKYHHLVTELDRDHIVDALPLPGLVEYCEELVFDDGVILPYLRNALAPFDLHKYGTVVLGCTHFPFYSSALRKVLPDQVDLIDGSQGTVRHLIRTLDKQGLLSDMGSREISFLTSGSHEEEMKKFHTLLTRLEKKGG